MSGLPGELRDLISSGPMAHLSTINADGSPQVSVIWIGLDGDDIVSSHLGWYAKLRNIERDPRVVLSFDAPRAPGVFMNPYAVVQARAAIEARQPWSVELLYADHEGGQRAISRFLALPVEHQFPAHPDDHQGQAAEARPGWLASASRHWSLDRPDPT